MNKVLKKLFQIILILLVTFVFFVNITHCQPTQELKNEKISKEFKIKKILTEEDKKVTDKRDTLILLLRFFIPIILSLLSAEIVDHIVSSRLGRSEQNAINGELEKMRSFIDRIVLNIFLPLIFCFAIFSTEITDIKMFLRLVAVGILFPFSTLIIAFIIYYKFRRSIGKMFWVPFIPATFGGGNRGTLLIMLISPIVVFLKFIGSSDEIISYFILIDLGNFIFLMFIIIGLLPLFVKKEIPSLEAPKGIGIPPSDSFIPRLIIFTIVLIKYFEIIGLFDGLKKYEFYILIKEAILGYSGNNSTIFMYLAFFSFFLMAKQFKQQIRDIRVVTFFKSISYGFISRSIGLIFSIVIIYILNVWKEINYSVIIGCLLLFLFLPPSSIYISTINEIAKLEQKGKKFKKLEYDIQTIAGPLNFWVNIIYVAAVVIFVIPFFIYCFFTAK